MKKLLLFTLVSAGLALWAAEYPLSNVRITAAKDKYQFAAEELKYHLELTGNKLSPGQDALEFVIGTPGARGALKPGEGRWLYKGGKVYFWGRDAENFSGTLSAVYGFLEEKLKVRWIYPGEDGISVPQQKSISFKEKESYRRTPPYFWGFLRSGLWQGYSTHADLIPQEWRISEEQLKKLEADNRLFVRRHRHGRIKIISYGHAFTKWPERFAKTHMDYFGVGPYGNPGIPSTAKYAKLCLSNPAVIDQIISDWQKAGAKKYLNVCPNDGTAGFCRCEKCMALDTRTKDENFYAHLTDRYLNFWNRVLKRAREINPDVMLVTYVYTYYRHPPRRERIEDPDHMLCGMVPVLKEDSGALFDAWKAVGLKNSFLRPNDTHPASPQVRGLEEHIFNKYQAARKRFKLYGVDYDGTLGIMSRDLEHYIVVRMIEDPEKSFPELMEEFCSAYGAAAETVRDFYAALRPAGLAMYLKNASAKRNQFVLDDSEVTVKANSDYCNILKEQLKKLEAFPQEKLSAKEKKRLARLIFSVKHNILYEEFKAQGDLALAGKENHFPQAAKALQEFRASTVKDFPENYPAIFHRSEARYWKLCPEFQKSGSKRKTRAGDPAAGWRNSFDEPSLQGWTPHPAFSKITDTDASFDRYSIEIKPGPGGLVLSLEDVAVTPEAKYELRFDAKASSGSFELRVKTKKKVIASLKTGTGSAHWVQKKETFTVPSGVTQLSLQLYAENLKDGGFFDNVVLKRLP